MDDPDFDDQPPRIIDAAERFFFTAIGFEIALGVVAVLAGKFFGPLANHFVPSVYDLWGVAWGVGLGSLLALPMVALVQGLQKLELPQIDEINQLGRDRILPLMDGLTNSELAVISIAAGVGEELLFRGWFQTLLTGDASQWSPVSIFIGISIASVVFGLAHAVTKLYVLVVAVMGILFGIMLVATGNLLVPIAAHAVFDFIQLRLAVRQFQGGAVEEP